MSEADEIYVLDTGSDDNTVKLLEDRGVNVIVKKIIPWRFDVARNESLKLVPEDADICVCTDLDEVFIPGWRKELECVWKKGNNRLRYVYNWSLDEFDKPIISFYGEKIHSRHNYKWTHPVHEILKYSGDNESFILTDNIIINHYPDSNKSRGSYLPLLELSVSEDPEDDRNMHYLGREYMYYSRWNECIDTLIKHLNLKTAIWKDERCASMRFIARSYNNLGRFDEAKLWLEKAIEEAPYLREPYVEMALLEYKLGNDIEVIKYCTLALTIKKNKMSYINESFCWDSTIDDLLSISYYNLGIYDIALYYIDRAISYDKTNERFLKNKEYILEKNNED
ncbi:MAG: glycosyl transferase family 2 [Bacilli bacterium]|nr:glycosyl transferase family 2 [Bacilli bacterium]